MKVLVSAYDGACYGVERALELAKEALEAGYDCTTLGPIIHNPKVVAELAEKGLEVAESVAEVTTGSVVIRSHGVAPEVKQEALAHGLRVIDATCPHVARAQRAASLLAEQGYEVLVVGKAGHPEVDGLCAYARAAGGSVVVVAGPQDLPEDLGSRVGVVVQTTQQRACLDGVVASLRARGIEPLVKDTICDATRLRQEAAADLAGKVDAMVVIGGRNSSNTTRLAEICASICPLTFHIEDVDELDPALLSSCKVVGITPGASTPKEHIGAVVKALESMETCVQP